MPTQYKCDYCNYVTIVKSSLIAHNNSKKHKFNKQNCKKNTNPTTDPTTTDPIIADPTIINPAITNPATTDPTTTNPATTNPATKTTTKTTSNSNTTNITCKYCTKFISHSSHIKRHESKCKKKEICNLKETVELLTKEKAVLVKELDCMKTKYNVDLNLEADADQNINTDHLKKLLSEKLELQIQLEKQMTEKSALQLELSSLKTNCYTLLKHIT